MGWFDDLKARAQQAGDNIVKDINSYIAGRVVEPVIKIGEPQRGNQTAAQIAQGQAGAPAQPLAESVQASVMKFAPIILGTVALALVLKKSRR